MRPKYGRRKGSDKSDARVSLWKDGVEHTHLVSRLVARTWCDGYADGLTVNHIDGDPHNNKVDNLEWVTLTENIRHGFENGLYPQKSILLIDEDGSAELFRSMICASRFLGKCDNYVSNYLARGGHVRPHGYTIVLMPHEKSPVQMAFH